MMIFNYPTKKSLKESIGLPLKFTETAGLTFGEEYRSNGEFTGYKREFFASVRMKNGLIFKVA